MPDIAIPIVFPDYLITVETPKQSFDVPDLIPGFDLLPDKVVIPKTKQKLPELGHAGILFINGANGTTKYYEYGRYQSDFGNVRKLSIRNVKMAAGGHPTRLSLAYTLSQISAKSGKGGRISAAYIEVPGKYQAMLNYCKKRMIDRSTEYSIWTNSCNHFMQEVLKAAAVNVPAMVDPRPNSYIQELRSDHNDLDYNYKTNTLKLEDPPKPLRPAINTKFNQPAARQ